MLARPKIEGYLAPQERFEAILAEAFRRHGPRVVDLGYANAYDGPDPRVLGAMREALADDSDLSFQYTPYGGNTTTRRLIAIALGKRFGLPLNFRDVVLTPGAMSALNVVFRSLFAGDEECLVLTPCWLDYPLYLENLAVPFRFVPLGREKHLDLEAIRAAITPRTRAILFSHPGCPSSVMLNDGELKDLADVLASAEAEHGTEICVIGDEVHRDVNWSGAPFHTVLQYHPRSVSIFSFGKALFLQGQRIGYIAVSPAMPRREEMRSCLERLVRVMGFCTPTNLMQRAVRSLLDYAPRLDVVVRRQAMARDALRAAGYEVIDGDATFFVYVRSPVADEFSFVERLAGKGVIVLPSSVFHEPGHFRLSLTARTEALEAGLPAFREVMA